MDRLKRFKQLMKQYGMTASDYDAGGEEDPRPYLNGTDALSRFVCVTVNYSSQGFARHYFLPVFHDIEHAVARATEHAADDIFEELPVAVVDLDTGETVKPQWNALPWLVEQPETAAAATSQLAKKTRRASRHRCAAGRADTT
jgi:hypothetical protein